MVQESLEFKYTAQENVNVHDHDLKKHQVFCEHQLLRIFHVPRLALVSTRSVKDEHMVGVIHVQLINVWRCMLLSAWIGTIPTKDIPTPNPSPFSNIRPSYARWHGAYHC